MNYLFMSRHEVLVQTHTLCITQVDKIRTLYNGIGAGGIAGHFLNRTFCNCVEDRTTGLRQASRQDLAAGGGHKPEGGHIFKIQYWMCVPTEGPLAPPLATAMGYRRILNTIVC